MYDGFYPVVLFTLVALIMAAIGVYHVASDAVPMDNLAAKCEKHGLVQNEQYRVECSVVWREGEK